MNIPEAYNIKERKENISSSSSFTSVQEKTDEEDNSIRTLKSDLEYLNLKDDQIRWACILKARYPAMPLEYAIPPSRTASVTVTTVTVWAAASLR